MSNFLQNAIWILQDAMQIITVCKRRAKQTVLGTGTGLPAIKLHMHQRPPAATDQRACMAVRPLRQQSGPSPTMVTQVSKISIYDSSGLRIKN